MANTDADNYDWREPGCPHCGGRGFTYCEPGNPNFVSPCGCDDPEEIEDDEGVE